jgi:hypothetical protein
LAGGGELDLVVLGGRKEEACLEAGAGGCFSPPGAVIPQVCVFGDAHRYLAIKTNICSTRLR